ncbi:UTRA domain-containing protein [Pseudonocardia sp. DR1-2]|uniref:UTRA domain-containing protein n=1 Tax=Pseudonocardia sp. DR1-2 TaxID=2951168 RepID=UPI002042C8B6|nr:UTRA domain-containing protein [Pseudonocardia sp. DR1-2]MCM3848514.1 UTRA domain-containing protein [Pseudonocardia sp. DR1-2]
MPVPSPNPRVRAADVRRLRDLLRIAVAGRGRPGDLLPGEDELMVRHGAPRAAVRAALGLLREEGLLRPGPTAHRIVARPHYPGRAAVTGTGARLPRWLERTGIAAPDVLADWLGVPVGAPCLRTECVSATAGGGAVLETHYVTTTAAARLLAVPGTGPFDRQLCEAGLRPASAGTRSGPVPADPDSAALLGVAAGTPLLGAERTLTGDDGRVLAVSVLRADPAGSVPAARDGAAAAQPDSSARTASSESASAGVLSGR